MTTKKFTLKQGTSLKKHLEKHLEKATAIAIQAAALHVVEDITAHIIPAEQPPPVDRGIYRGGWRAQPTKDGAMIVNTVPHATFIEYGVRGANVKPGKLMINALASWAKRKGIAKGGKNGPKSAAFAIAMSMKKKGIFNRKGGAGSGGGGKSMVKRGGGGLLRKVMRILRGKLAGMIGKSTKKHVKSKAGGSGGPAGGLRILERAMRGIEKHLQREIGSALKKVFQ